MAPNSTIRAELTYSGRVQGVGFRYTAASLARGFRVTGFVRNRPDGTVELVAEGAPAEVYHFLDAVRKQFERHIREVSRYDRPASGEFPDFAITG